uniref:Uncharacterized protein n=1 Tax=Sphaerodactylus townsendi TaxID=933632 RepID=A0ACB8FPX4_9SAUR
MSGRGKAGLAEEEGRSAPERGIRRRGERAPDEEEESRGAEEKLGSLSVNWDLCVSWRWGSHVFAIDRCFPLPDVPYAVGSRPL